MTTLVPLRNSTVVIWPMRTMSLSSFTMKPRRTLKQLWPVLVGTALGFLVATAHASSTRTQTIALHKGWNSVYLEVSPSKSDPAAVFAGTPIDIAASYYLRNSSAQFVSNPGADMFKKAGWGVWYAGNRPDAFLKSLYSVYGQQAYLIHSKSDALWQVTGEVVTPETRWQPNAYNLVGFSVTSPGSPTFAQFFSGSVAHKNGKIYRLANGAWRRVLDPSAETMQSGEAFWIYCAGPSKYQGPLRVETTLATGLYLGAGAGSVVLRNDTDHPVTPTVEHVPIGTNSIPLSIVIRSFGDKSGPVQTIAVPKPDGAWTQDLPVIEAGGSLQVPLEARLQDVGSAVQNSLLRVVTDMGTQVWVPVIGVRKDLEDK
jgi:hypothetical protein